MVVKQLNSSYFWSPVEKTDFCIGVVIPVTHENKVLNALQIPEGKAGFNLTRLARHRFAIPFLSHDDSPGLKGTVSRSVNTSANLFFSFFQQKRKKNMLLILTYFIVREKNKRKENGQENRSFFRFG